MVSHWTKLGFGIEGLRNYLTTPIIFDHPRSLRFIEFRWNAQFHTCFRIIVSFFHELIPDCLLLSIPWSNDWIIKMLSRSVRQYEDARKQVKRHIYGKSKTLILIESITKNDVHLTSKHSALPKHNILTCTSAFVQENCFHVLLSMDLLHPYRLISFFLLNAIFPYFDIPSAPFRPYFSSFLWSLSRFIVTP